MSKSKTPRSKNFLTPLNAFEAVIVGGDHIHPFNYTSKSKTCSTSSTRYVNQWQYGTEQGSSADWGRAINGALGKVTDKLNVASDLTTAMVERKKTIDMFVTSIQTLIRAARAIKRRDPRIIAAVLKKHPEKKDIIKTPAGLWLGYWFGLAPTIQDAHHAMQLFSADFPPYDLSVSSSSKGSKRYDTVNDKTHISGDLMEWNYKCSVRLGCKIKVRNPNLLLLRRLGLDQPLSVAWEITPFSWFVDYFVSVGDFINNANFTFAGFDVSDKYYTRFSRCDFIAEHHDWQQLWPGPTYRLSVTDVTHCKLTTMSRTLSFPSYQLYWKGTSDINAKRVSYVVAVLVQLLTSFKR